MAGHPHHLDVGELAGPLVIQQGPVQVDAELVLFKPRGDIGVGLGVDVRVDAQGHRRPHLKLAGDPGDLPQLLGGLDVEHENAGLEGLADFLEILAHPGINDFLGGDAGLGGPKEFPAADDVRPRAQPREEPQDGQVAIGLHRKADEVGVTRKSFVKGAEVVGEGRVAIQVEGGPHRRGDFRHRHVFTMKFTVDVVEVMHAPARYKNSPKAG